MGDFEQTLREIFGDSISKVSGFQQEQMKKLSSKIGEIAKDSLREELARLSSELADLRARVAVLEAERIQSAK